MRHLSTALALTLVATTTTAAPLTDEQREICAGLSEIGETAMELRESDVPLRTVLERYRTESDAHDQLNAMIVSIIESAYERPIVDKTEYGNDVYLECVHKMRKR